MVKGSGVRLGPCPLFCTGSTGALTAIEYEPGLARDFPRALDRLAPRGEAYAHDSAGDDNGRSHVEASLQKPDLVVPVRDGERERGRWQHVVFVEGDTRARTRTVAVRVGGE